MEINASERAVLEALSRNLQVGETVVIVGGRDKGRTGRFCGFGRDSGYLVPFVALGERAETATADELSAAARGRLVPYDVARPWPYEVAAPRLLREHRDAVEAKLREADGLIDAVSALETGEPEPTGGMRP